jgi:hypothetical protein
MAPPVQQQGSRQPCDAAAGNGDVEVPHDAALARRTDDANGAGAGQAESPTIPDRYAG